MAEYGEYEQVDLDDINSEGYGEYINPDRGAVDAVADDEIHDSPTLLKRFFKEIKYYDFVGFPQSTPKGRPIWNGLEMERIDPQHRFPAFQQQAKRSAEEERRINLGKNLILDYLAGNPTGSSAQFISWLKIKNSAESAAVLELIERWKQIPPEAAELEGMVRYLDNEKRQLYVIEPQTDGDIFCRKPRPDLTGVAKSIYFDHVAYDTRGAAAAFQIQGVNRQNKAIWVQGPSGRFYSNKLSQAGKFHHSSFLEGHHIKAAGDWEVIDGKLLTISAISGHYRPPLEALHEALVDLTKVTKKILTNTEVELFAADTGAYTKIKALEFIENAEKNEDYLGQFRPI